MTTQNILPYRTTFANLAAATYYYPSATGVNCDTFDHLQFRLKLVSGDVNNTLEATVEADDGFTGTFEWPETRGLYDFLTGGWGAASWIATNTTTRARGIAWDHNARLWRVKLVVTLGAAANNSGIVGIRGVKV